MTISPISTKIAYKFGSLRKGEFKQGYKLLFLFLLFLLSVWVNGVCRQSFDKSYVCVCIGMDLKEKCDDFGFYSECCVKCIGCTIGCLHHACCCCLYKKTAAALFGVVIVSG